MEELTTEQEMQLTLLQAKEFLEEQRGIKTDRLVIAKFAERIHDFELWMQNGQITY